MDQHAIAGHRDVRYLPGRNSARIDFKAPEKLRRAGDVQAPVVSSVVDRLCRISWSDFIIAFASRLALALKAFSWEEKREVRACAFRQEGKIIHYLAASAFVVANSPRLYGQCDGTPGSEF
jgi:hypothetical protein